MSPAEQIEVTALNNVLQRMSSAEKSRLVRAQSRLKEGFLGSAVFLGLGAAVGTAVGARALNIEAALVGLLAAAAMSAWIYWNHRRNSARDTAALASYFRQVNQEIERLGGNSGS